jgi:leucyl aminopeptidase
MDVAVETSPGSVSADILGFAVADPTALPAPLQELDGDARGRLARLVDDGELTGTRGSLTLVHALDGQPAQRLAAVGVGPDSELDADALRSAAAALAVRAGAIGGTTLGWLLADGGPLDAAEQARAVVDGVVLGGYDAGRWKTDGERPQPLERLVLCGPGADGVAEAARETLVVATWANRCRDHVSAPPNEATPERIAEFAREVADRFDSVTAGALGPDEIGALGMGAFTAVAQGSHTPARLVTLRHEPEGADQDIVLGLVGKAITFDSGGISLKPADGLEEMKSDMSGGGAAIAALGAIAELGLPVRTLAVVPACENMPGGHAFRPGDIVTAADGTTIEIVNTDAEGRLVLADALWYARREGATHVLDLATLTGTMEVALGDFYAGLFGNDPDWVARVRDAAERSGDHAWPFPLHASYERHLESTYADLKNCPEKRRGSSIIAALFLQRFAGEGPWAHLDIAGTAFLGRPRDYYPNAGATGYGVRLIGELARGLSAGH